MSAKLFSELKLVTDTLSIWCLCLKEKETWNLKGGYSTTFNKAGSKLAFYGLTRTLYVHTLLQIYFASCCSSN